MALGDLIRGSRAPDWSDRAVGNWQRRLARIPLSLCGRSSHLRVQGAAAACWSPAKTGSSEFGRGFDPATASAPFVATLVDVTGLVIYFTVA
jgi:hypothetical protein